MTRTKQEATDKQTDEADHTVNSKEAELKAKQQEHSATDEEVNKIIDKLEEEARLERLRQEEAARVERLRKMWADPEFLKLVEDRKLMKQLEKICQDLTNRFRTSVSYSSEDLMLDVIEQIVKGLPQFRHESKLTSWLYKIARNQLINVYRKPAYKAPSLKGTTLRDRNGEEYELDSAATEGGEPAGRFAATYRNHVEEGRVRLILLDQLIGMLSPEELSLCVKYYVDGLTMQKIAAEEGRTRQAVSNQFGRMMKRLRKILE
ncbi:MAG TPA: sigma-70 family RNA polymerase sigma factor [Pyrinomonadaceae bacterium]|nr:sigma-70 family RNA polymerase sigma factor [Pyrinomonadaceae bacterium]